jgi:hypothetical protein
MRLALVAALILIHACEMGSPPTPDPSGFSWTTYVNGAVGYSMQVPDVYSVDEEADDAAVFFRWNGRVPVKVYFADESTGEHLGLWPGHEPTGDIRLGGQSGRLYEYTHCDGPFCSRMRSYVIPHRDRMLGLEFRAKGELDTVNLQILASFSLLDADPAEDGAAGGSSR